MTEKDILAADVQRVLADRQRQFRLLSMMVQGGLVLCLFALFGLISGLGTGRSGATLIIGAIGLGFIALSFGAMRVIRERSQRRMMELGRHAGIELPEL